MLSLIAKKTITRWVLPGSAWRGPARTAAPRGTRPLSAHSAAPSLVLPAGDRRQTIIWYPYIISSSFVYIHWLFFLIVISCVITCFSFFSNQQSWKLLQTIDIRVNYHKIDSKYFQHARASWSFSKHIIHTLSDICGVAFHCINLCNLEGSYA